MTGGSSSVGSNSHDSVDAAAFWLALLVIAYWPYALMLEARVGWHILGFSVFVTIGPSLLILFSWLLLSLRRPKYALVPLVMFALILLSVVARWATNISESQSILVRDFAGVRYLLLVPCYFITARTVVKTDRRRRMVIFWVLTGGAITAAAGVADTLGVLPSGLVPVTEGKAVLDSLGGGRATGIFTGSNQFGNFLVIPFIICSLVPLRMWTRLALMILFVAGILSSGSRLAMVIGGLAVLLVSSGRKMPRWQRALQVIGLLVALFAAPRLVSNAATSVNERFDQDVFLGDATGRYQKTMLGVSALFSDGYSILLGTTPSAVVLGEGADEQFSDNSFVQVAISVGLPAATLFASLMWVLIRRTRVSDRELLFLRVFWMVMLITAANNNFILWDINLLYSAVLYWLLISFSVDTRGAVPLRFVSPTSA